MVSALEARLTIKQDLLAKMFLNYVNTIINVLPIVVSLFLSSRSCCRGNQFSGCQIKVVPHDFRLLCRSLQTCHKEACVYPTSPIGATYTAQNAIFTCLHNFETFFYDISHKNGQCLSTTEFIENVGDNLNLICLEAVFWAQTNLKLANDSERLVIFIESKCIEIEITIFSSKPDFDQISSVNDVLGKAKFMGPNWNWLTLIRSKVCPSVVISSSVTVTCSAALHPVIFQSSKFDSVDSGWAE